MARLLLVVLFALCSSCMQLNVPSPRIEFTSIEYDSGHYNLRFRSDRDLVNLYDAHGISGQVGTWLICSLDGDNDFSILHHIRYTAKGVVDEVRTVEGDRRYEFNVNLRFKEDVSHGSSSLSIRKEVLLSMLKAQDYIPCRTTTTATFYKAYYSKIMYIPTSRIMKEVQHQITAPEYVILPPGLRPLSWLTFEQICITDKRYHGGDIIVHGGVCSSMPYSSILSSFAPRNGKFRIFDTRTQQPKADVRYMIKRPDGREEEGLSDARGDTHVFGSNHPENFKLFLFEDGLGASAIQ